MDVILSDDLSSNWNDILEVVLGIRITLSDTNANLDDTDSFTKTFSTPSVQDSVTQEVVEVGYNEANEFDIRVSQVVVEEAHIPDHLFDIRASQLVVEEAHEPDHEFDIQVTQLIVEVAYKMMPGGWKVYEVRRV